MDNLQTAIENITFYTKKFPAEEFRYIVNHKEEALPYLRAALNRAIEEGADLDKGYELHLYALFFLAEFHDRESFKKIITLASLPSEILDGLIGDAVTEGLRDILYHTYDGNLELLENAIRNPDLDEYVRMAMLDVIGQLYLDGDLDRERWRDCLRELVHCERDEEIGFLSAVAEKICQCHFVDMLQEVRYLWDHELIDVWMCGEYDSYVDIMFHYPAEEERFCKETVSAESLKHWAMFEQEKTGRRQFEEDFEEDFLESIEKSIHAPVQKKSKVGRNDPCPCGSGRKYKHCCLNKSQKRPGQIESEEEQKKWLKDYPETGVDRREGRVYLEDFFDSDSIEIDRLLYLGMRERDVPIWEREKAQMDSIETIKRLYLCEAFSRFVEKMHKEGIKTTEEYDEKYSIHYLCREWMEKLLELLKETGEDDKYQSVLKYYKE